MFTRTISLFAMLLALPACGDASDYKDTPATLGESSGDTGIAGGGEEDSGEPVDEDGASETSGEEALPPELVRTCDLPIPCEDPVELVRQSGSQGYAASDLCALAAFGRESTGLIQTVAVFASAESYLDHVIVGPGEVLRQANGRSDSLGYWQKPVERCVLKDPAFFAACIHSYDPACLDTEQWVDGCEPLGSLTCPQA